MIRLSLLLLGTGFVRARWRALAAIGACWLLLGIGLFADALDGVLLFPLRAFAVLLLVEGLVGLGVSLSGLAVRNGLRVARAVLFIGIALLIFVPQRHGDFVLAMLFGLVFTIGGALRISAAWVVRFRGWRGAIAAGAVELLLAVFMFEPWPTHYAGTVPYCIGIALALSGWPLLRLAWRLRRLPPDVPTVLLSARSRGAGVPSEAVAEGGAPLQPLVVHVWTPLGSAVDPVRRPLLDRYIAAVDAQGVISTGHAAMEVPPDLYISHYPAVELDRSPDEFSHTLMATPENDVAGRFQPSYAEEAAGWCESTVKVVFPEYGLARLRAFWSRYRADTTYNLTNRNCSSTVVVALESALDGVIGRRGGGWRSFARMLSSPELWLASQLYRRAETMAWTPGLALDYARALHGVVHPPPMSWWLLLRTSRRRLRGVDDAAA